MGPAGDRDLTAARVEAEADQHRGTSEEVREPAGRGLEQRRPLEGEIDDRGARGALAQGARGALRILAQADDDLRAPSGAREGTGEGAIDRGAHAHGVDARALGKPLQDLTDELLLEPDEPVGNQHHLALGFGAQGLQGLDDGGTHLGAAGGTEPAEPREGFGPGLGCGPDGAVVPPARRISELDELELIVGLE